MDTNALQNLINLMQQTKGNTFDPSAIIIIGIIVAALAPTLAGIAGYFKSKAALVNSQQAKLTAENTAEEVKKIHQAVNNERTVMLDKVQQLTDNVLSISKENETLKEKQRGMEVIQPAIHTVNAIKETTEAVKDVKSMVASEVSVTELMKKLLEVLEASKPK